MYSVYVHWPIPRSYPSNLAKNNLKANTVAIMVNNSSDYSDGVAEAFIKEAERLGLKIVAKEDIRRR